MELRVAGVGAEVFETMLSHIANGGAKGTRAAPLWIVLGKRLWQAGCTHTYLKYTSASIGRRKIQFPFFPPLTCLPITSQSFFHSSTLPQGSTTHRLQEGIQLPSILSKRCHQPSYLQERATSALPHHTPLIRSLVSYQISHLFLQGRSWRKSLLSLLALQYCSTHHQKDQLTGGDGA